MAQVYTFPSDLTEASDYGHMMVFSAYTPQSARFAPLAGAVGQSFQYAGQTLNAGGFLNNPAGQFLNAYGQAIAATGSRQILDQFFLYIPGGGQNNLVWSQRHDYDDVKMSRIGTGAASGISSAILGIGQDTITTAAGTASSIFRVTINPLVEVLYRGTDLRGFDFSFMFAPQSEEDSKILYGNGPGDGLLNRFRFHAAPEFGGPAGSLFLSPSEWEIEFYYKQSTGPQAGSWMPNTKIPKIAKGVLVRVDVDYNPDSEFSTYEQGDPISSRLTMRFVEMEIIDKKRINEGF